MPYLKSAGARLKEYRLNAGIGLREFARRIDFSSGYVSKVESGEKRGSVDFFQRCAKELNISTGDLFEEQKTTLTEEMKEEGVEWILLFNEMKAKGITTEDVLKWIREYKEKGE